MTSKTWAARRVAAAFVVAALCALGFVAAYVLGGSPQWQGLLIGLAFAALSYGLASWSSTLLPATAVVEEKHPLPPPPEQRQRLAQDLTTSGSFPPVVRRALLLAGGALGLAAVVPLRSLLVRDVEPEDVFRDTPWRAGLRLVTRQGEPVRAEDLQVGTVLTAYPEGAPLAQDGVVVVVRVPPDVLRLPAGRQDWAVDGIVAFSKLCTHVGCPVGLYEQTTRQLLCPCHQSAFDVPRGAVPVQGPAARPLPQLPLELGPGGFLRAAGGFPAPVGPTWWRRT